MKIENLIQNCQSLVSAHTRDSYVGAVGRKKLYFVDTVFCMEN
jgi:hypothetical protein